MADNFHPRLVSNCPCLPVFECNGNDSTSEPNTLSARTAPKTTCRAHSVQAFTTVNVPLKKTTKKTHILRHGQMPNTLPPGERQFPSDKTFNSWKYQAAQCCLSPCFCFLRQTADTHRLRGCTVNLCGPCLRINTSDILWLHIDPTASPDVCHQTVPDRSSFYELQEV